MWVHVAKYQWATGDKHYMAAVPIYCKIPSKRPAQLIQSVGFTSDSVTVMESPSYFYSLSSNLWKKSNVAFPDIDVSTKTKGKINASKPAIGASSYFKTLSEAITSHTRCDIEQHIRFNSRDDCSQGSFWCASDSNTNEQQLRSLDSYFGKLQDCSNRAPSDISNNREELHSKSSQMKVKKRLETLDAYLEKLKKEKGPSSIVEPSISSTFEESTAVDSSTTKPIYIHEDSERRDQLKVNSYINQRYRSGNRGLKSAERLQQNDETSDLYLMSILVSINIAVFLFEIASPVRNSDLELFSLPLVYGAKINHLILIGEWWRLVTPMFLHTGIFHIALSCWALFTFGPKVCKGYGSFTSFLIYILGGISGNLISFLHTPEPTVGGTGPVYAIIGAWLIYQIQNKDVIAKDVSETLLQKAIITTALGFILSNFGLIDDWTHFGAAFTGVAYGYFTCPTLQLDDTSSNTGQEERNIALVKRYADPCKSFFLFSIFIIILSSFLFFMEPPLNALALDNFV